MTPGACPSTCRAPGSASFASSCSSPETTPGKFIISARPITRRRRRRPSRSPGENGRRGDSNCEAGTLEEAMKKTSSGRPPQMSSSQCTPSVPSTFAISCGSTTTVVVPSGSTSRANSSTSSFVVSRCMCASTKPGTTKRPEASSSSAPSYSPSPATWPSTIATSASSHSRVKTEKTRPPRRTRSAGSSPRATASRRERSGIRATIPLPERGRPHSPVSGRGSSAQGRAPRGGADSGRDRCDGGAQLRPCSPACAAEPERGTGASGLVARERDAAPRFRAHLHRGDAAAARRGGPRPGRGFTNRRRPTDPQSRDDRREPGHVIACGRRVAAVARLRRRARARQHARLANHAARRVPGWAEAQHARAGRADRRRARPGGRPAPDVHEGRAAQCDGYRGRLARGRGGRGTRRGACRLRLRRTRAGPRDSPARRAGRAPGARGRRSQPDRRCARDSDVPPSRATGSDRPCARTVPRMRIELTVNGERKETEVWEGESLLFALRERLGLPGSKNACEQGECGSCSVVLDGTMVCACLVLAAQADGHHVVTVEGLGQDGRLHRVQDAFAETGAVQCGFCTPGLIVATADLLEHNPQPTEDEIREALSGNLCRCTGYAKIFDAVRLAAGALDAK